MFDIKMQDMKAILKRDRKVTVDVELWEKWYSLTEHTTECMYKDKNGNTYHDYELEIIEYYGG